MRAADVIELLGLEPLPGEGGYFAETWRDRHSSAIYYLLVPGDFSAMHRVDAMELWLHYGGAAVELLWDPPGGSDISGYLVQARWRRTDAGARPQSLRWHPTTETSFTIDRYFSYVFGGRTPAADPPELRGCAAGSSEPRDQSRV